MKKIIIILIILSQQIIASNCFENKNKFKIFGSKLSYLDYKNECKYMGFISGNSPITGLFSIGNISKYYFLGFGYHDHFSKWKSDYTQHRTSLSISTFAQYNKSVNIKVGGNVIFPYQGIFNIKDNDLAPNQDGWLTPQLTLGLGAGFQTGRFGMSIDAGQKGEHNKLFKELNIVTGFSFTYIQGRKMSIKK